MSDSRFCSSWARFALMPGRCDVSFEACRRTALRGTSHLSLRCPREQSEKAKMIEGIPLVCAGCGATVMRHRAMRLRRIVCLECVQKEKSKIKRARNEKRLGARKAE